MKSFKLTIASITLAGIPLTPAMVNASDPPTPTMDSKKTDLKIETPKDPSRPRVPSNQTIHIVFTPLTQECFFGLPENIDHISVEVICEETGFSFYDEVYASNPIAVIPMTSGNHTIICTTDDGAIFSGTLYI